MITTLSPFGGPRLAKLFAKIDHLAQLAGGSTHDQVADVVDQLREATAEALASRYNARTLQHDLLGPLGAVKVETLIGELTAVQVKEVVTAVGVERVAAILATNQAGRSETLAKATELFGNVDTLNQVLRRCAVHLDAADTAKFVDESVLRGWKLAAPLETFFALAGRAHHEARQARQHVRRGRQRRPATGRPR